MPPSSTRIVSPETPYPETVTWTVRLVGPGVDTNVIAGAVGGAYGESAPLDDTTTATEAPWALPSRPGAVCEAVRTWTPVRRSTVSAPGAVGGHRRGADRMPAVVQR